MNRLIHKGAGKCKIISLFVRKALQHTNNEFSLFSILKNNFSQTILLLNKYFWFQRSHCEEYVHHYHLRHYEHCASSGNTIKQKS